MIWQWRNNPSVTFVERRRADEGDQQGACTLDGPTVDLAWLVARINRRATDDRLQALHEPLRIDGSVYLFGWHARYCGNG
jgi:hypothetical protein